MGDDDIDPSPRQIFEKHFNKNAIKPKITHPGNFVQKVLAPQGLLAKI
jgi:hypothetical protein